jgi:hypothetical protein
MANNERNNSRAINRQAAPCIKKGRRGKGLGMATPSAYAKIREKQRQESIENEKRYKAQAERIKQEDQRFFDQLCVALNPYHNQNLDGHKITLKKSSKDKKVNFIVDGKLYLTFSLKDHWHPCTRISCEGASCDHDYTDHTIDYFYGEENNGHFFCYRDNNQINNPDCFAKELAKLMDRYKERS